LDRKKFVNSYINTPNVLIAALVLYAIFVYFNVNHYESISEGTKQFENGDKYVGELQYGEFQGEGTYFFVNGDRYEGAFNHASGVDGRLYKKGGESQRALLRRIGLSEWQVLLVDLPDCPFEQPARYFKVKKALHNCFAIVDKEFDGTLMQRFYGEWRDGSISGVGVEIFGSVNQRIGNFVDQRARDTVTETSGDLELEIVDPSISIENAKYYGRIINGTIEWSTVDPGSREYVKDNEGFVVKSILDNAYWLVYGVFPLFVGFLILTALSLYKLSSYLFSKIRGGK